MPEKAQIEEIEVVLGVVFEGMLDAADTITPDDLTEFTPSLFMISVDTPDETASLVVTILEEETYASIIVISSFVNYESAETDYVMVDGVIKFTVKAYPDTTTIGCTADIDLAGGSIVWLAMDAPSVSGVSPNGTMTANRIEFDFADVAFWDTFASDFLDAWAEIEGRFE